jgi:hypothetical protein
MDVGEIELGKHFQRLVKVVESRISKMQYLNATDVINDIQILLPKIKQEYPDTYKNIYSYILDSVKTIKTDSEMVNNSIQKLINNLS